MLHWKQTSTDTKRRSRLSDHVQRRSTILQVLLQTSEVISVIYTPSVQEDKLFSEITCCSFYLGNLQTLDISSKTPFEHILCNKSNVKPLFPPSGSTDLYCGILRSWHHDTEDWVEDDAGDWTAVATQRVPFWWAWDPLFGIALLTDRPSQGDLLFSFIQFGFKFHHLFGAVQVQVNSVEAESRVYRNMHMSR